MSREEKGKPVPMDLLMRERAELRSELDSTADQIGQLQTTIANNTHMDAVHLYHPTSREQPQTQSLSKLREDLVQALRDNELLRQAIGKGISSDLQSGVGHRTVSSTQLASAARPGLSAQQRWEVQDMVRRQENLRRSQTDAFEEQIKTLKRDRQEAEQKLTLAESRLECLLSPPASPSLPSPRGTNFLVACAGFLRRLRT